MGTVMHGGSAGGFHASLGHTRASSVHARVHSQRRWSTAMSNDSDRESRCAQALPHIEEAVFIITQAGRPNADLTYEDRIDQFRLAMDSTSRAFGIVTRHRCRACVKYLGLAEMTNTDVPGPPSFCAETLYRNSNYAGPDPRHMVHLNTAFNALLDSDAAWFVGNDLLHMAREGLYDNTTPDWVRRYRAAVVWPIRWPSGPLQIPTDLIGYLCVDARRRNVFVDWDYYLGALVCHALAPILGPLLDAQILETPE